jgi:HK97 family phage major capsid protein
MDIRAHVVALNEKRAAASKTLNDHLDDCHARHPGEAMTAEERQTEDRILAEIDGLEDEIRRFVAREEREQRSAELRDASAAVFGEARVEKAEQSDADRLRAWAKGQGSKQLDIDMSAVINAHQAMAAGASGRDLRNSLLWDTGSVGSTVPTTLASTLYEYLEASVALFRAPTTKINTASGEAMQFPKLSAHAIGTQVIAQGTAIGGTDPTFARMQLDAYKYGQLVQVASEVVEDSAIDIVSFVGRDVGRGIGRVIAADLAVGTGTGEPNGIMTSASGAGTISTGGSLINATYELLVDLVYSVNDEYRASGSAGFLMKDATAGQLRKLRDGAGGTVGAVLWEPSLTAGIQNGQPDRLLGFPVYTDPNVAAQGSAAKSIGFGDFASQYVRTVGALRLERSDDFAFNTDLVTFRGKWRADSDNIDPTTGGAVGAWNVLRHVP